LSSNRSKALKLPAEAGDGEQALSSGRRLVIRETDGGEDVEIHAPNGDLEVVITITPDGPVVRLSGARLELEATDTVSLKARNVELQASELTTMHSDGHLTLTSGLDIRTVAEGDVHVLGNIVWLN
jgi:hypothetical protein